MVQAYKYQINKFSENGVTTQELFVTFAMILEEFCGTMTKQLNGLDDGLDYIS